MTPLLLESIHPVTDGNKRREPQSNISPRSENPAEERSGNVGARAGQRHHHKNRHLYLEFFSLYGSPLLPEGSPVGCHLFWEARHYDRNHSTLTLSLLRFNQCFPNFPYLLTFFFYFACWCHYLPPFLHVGKKLICLSLPWSDAQHTVRIIK